MKVLDCRAEKGLLVCDVWRDEGAIEAWLGPIGESRSIWMLITELKGKTTFWKALKVYCDGRGVASVRELYDSLSLYRPTVWEHLEEV